MNKLLKVKLDSWSYPWLKKYWELLKPKICWSWRKEGSKDKPQTVKYFHNLPRILFSNEKIDWKEGRRHSVTISKGLFNNSNSSPSLKIRDFGAFWQAKIVRIMIFEQSRGAKIVRISILNCQSYRFWSILTGQNCQNFHFEQSKFQILVNFEGPKLLHFPFWTDLMLGN